MLLEQLIENGWHIDYDGDGWVASSITLISLQVVRKGGSTALVAVDGANRTQLTPWWGRETSFIDAWVTTENATVGQLIGIEALNIDREILKRLVAADWIDEPDGPVRGDWAICRNALALIGHPDAPAREVTGKFDSLFALMQSPFGSTTVAEFCGVKILDFGKY